MSDWNLIQELQKNLCQRLKVPWTPLDIKSMIAFNDSLFSDAKPINGLRHPKQGHIEGWYLWSGPEIPQENAEFFKPLHVEHLLQEKNIVLRYLGLPPGWRFQIDQDGYEDIWFDNSLLTI